MNKQEMKAWAREKLVGVMNVTLPSFTPDLQQLDEDGIRWDVRQAIAHGFFATCCITESHLSFDECKRFVEIVADEAGDRLLVMVNLHLDSFARNLALAEHATKVGVDLVHLGFPPDFYPRDVEEIYSAGSKMLEHIDLPVMLDPSPQFNFERFHHAGYPPELIERFAAFDNVVAAQIRSPDLASEALDRVGDAILVSSPWERLLPTMWAASRQQFIGPGPFEALQSPKHPYLVDYFRLLREGKEDAAWNIYWHLTPARAMFEQQNAAPAQSGLPNWPLWKYYQWLTGGNGGMVRQPTMKIHLWETEPLKGTLMRLGIEPRQPDEEFYYGRVNFEKMMQGGNKPSAADARRLPGGAVGEF